MDGDAGAFWCDRALHASTLQLCVNPPSPPFDPSVVRRISALERRDAVFPGRAAVGPRDLASALETRLGSTVARGAHALCTFAIAAGRETVDRASWERFVDSFGPGVSVAVTKATSSLLSPDGAELVPWWHGPIDRAEGQRLLDRKPVGSFLYRTSGQRGCLTVQFVASDGIKNSLVHTLGARGFSTAPPSDGGPVFASLHEMIALSPGMLSTPIPSSLHEGSRRAAEGLRTAAAAAAAAAARRTTPTPVHDSPYGAFDTASIALTSGASGGGGGGGGGLGGTTGGGAYGAFDASVAPAAAPTRAVVGGPMLDPYGAFAPSTGSAYGAFDAPALATASVPGAPSGGMYGSFDSPAPAPASVFGAPPARPGASASPYGHFDA